MRCIIICSGSWTFSDTHKTITSAKKSLILKWQSPTITWQSLTLTWHSLTLTWHSQDNHWQSPTLTWQSLTLTWQSLTNKVLLNIKQTYTFLTLLPSWTRLHYFSDQIWWNIFVLNLFEFMVLGSLIPHFFVWIC